MKRSELINKLCRDIEMWKDAGAPGSVIELILDKCESYGMEPPKRIRKKSIMEFTSHEIVNEWENEDETK